MARSSQNTILQGQDRHKISFYYGKIVTKYPFTLARSSQNTILQGQDRHKNTTHSGKNVTTPFHSVAKLSQFSVVLVIRHVLGLLQKFKLLLHRSAQVVRPCGACAGKW